MQVEFKPRSTLTLKLPFLCRYHLITYYSWVASQSWFSQITGQFRNLFGKVVVELNGMIHSCWWNSLWAAHPLGSRMMKVLLLLAWFCLRELCRLFFSLGGFIIHHIPFLAGPTQAASGSICISSLISYTWEAVFTNKLRSRVFHPRGKYLIYFLGLKQGWWFGFSVSISVSRCRICILCGHFTCPSISHWYQWVCIPASFSCDNSHS